MTETAVTYDLSLLRQSQAKWLSSAALRALYHDIFRDMASQCISGPSLELGAGIGVAGEVIPELVTSDLVKTEFVDRAVSAYEIPEESWANILAMDTLHHLQKPFAFFESAARALREGGRIVLMEPAGTWWGRKFYRVMHHEPCVPGQIVPPFEFPADRKGEFANMGMGVGLMRWQRDETDRRLAECGLRVAEIRYRDFVAYPATGGFSKPALLPAMAIKGLLAMERLIPDFIGRHWALRMMIVFEKSSEASSDPS